ncbi:MAG: DUF5777 family beta-barrel protein [Longimicrobiales bacterium]
MTLHLSLRNPLLALLALGLGSLSSPAGAQDHPRGWERRVEPTEPPLTLFHAAQVVNLPTAETLAKGEWQFEIAHRFFPAVSEGVDALWGLDGPANMRLGLGFAPSNRILLTLARSNFMDNWDFQAKLGALEAEVGPLPLMLALQAGAAWSTDVPDRETGDSGNFQYYGQLILNTRLGDRIALGVVPSYLYNVLLDPVDPVQDLFWGFYGQLYLTRILSVMGELNLGEKRGDLEHHAGAFGFELETGGHFFKIFLTNSVRLNPSQYLVGTDFPFEPEEWRLGFAITRLLRF